MTMQDITFITGLFFCLIMPSSAFSDRRYTVEQQKKYENYGQLIISDFRAVKSISSRVNEGFCLADKHLKFTPYAKVSVGEDVYECTYKGVLHNHAFYWERLSNVEYIYDEFELRDMGLL